MKRNSFMAPICLSLPSLAHIFGFHLKKSEKIMLLAKTWGVEEGKIQLEIYILYSCLESEVETGVEWSLTVGFDVNICDNINHIPRGDLHSYLSLSFPLPHSFSLSPVKIKVTKGDVNGVWYFTVTEERERHSNMLMIWWWARQKMKV